MEVVYLLVVCFSENLVAASFRVLVRPLQQLDDVIHVIDNVRIQAPRGVAALPEVHAISGGVGNDSRFCVDCFGGSHRFRLQARSSATGVGLGRIRRRLKLLVDAPEQVGEQDNGVGGDTRLLSSDCGSAVLHSLRELDRCSHKLPKLGVV